jgi:hypothetical protein
MSLSDRSSFHVLIQTAAECSKMCYLKDKDLTQFIVLMGKAWNDTVPCWYRQFHYVTSYNTSVACVSPYPTSDTKCTVLAVLVGFTDYITQLVTLFYCRLYSSVLQSFLTVHSDPLMSCLRADFRCPLASKASGWLTSRRILRLTGLLSWLSQHLCCLGNTTVSVAWKYCIAIGLHFHCVGNVGIRNQPLHSSVNNRLPSRCLGMDAHYENRCVGSVNPSQY